MNEKLESLREFIRSGNPDLLTWAALKLSAFRPG